MPLSYRLLESGTIRLTESGSSRLTEASAATVAAGSSAGTGAGVGTTDAALFPDVVWLLPLSESPDGDGGPAESFPAPSGPGLACTVKATRLVRAAYAGEEEVGITPAVVAFPSDPGALKGDRLLWLGRVIRLLAPARPTSGSGSLYTAQGEIRD